MPAPAAFAPLVGILIHLAFGGQQFINEILGTPDLVTALLMILEEDGSRGAADVVRHARWKVRSNVLMLFSIMCREGKKVAQSLLSQGRPTFLGCL
jgi:hypothetical protein